MRLARPACTKGVLPVQPLPTERDHERGRRQARVPDLLSSRLHALEARLRAALRRGASSFDGADWSTIAQDFADPDALILHTCDTGGASSGSPLLLDGADGPEVIGINVGTYVQSKVLMQEGKVTQRLKADTVANTAVAARAFAAKLEAFRRRRSC